MNVDQVFDMNVDQVFDVDEDNEEYDSLHISNRKKKDISIPEYFDFFSLTNSTPSDLANYFFLSINNYPYMDFISNPTFPQYHVIFQYLNETDPYQHLFKLTTIFYLILPHFLNEKEPFLDESLGFLSRNYYFMPAFNNIIQYIKWQNPFEQNIESEFGDFSLFFLVLKIIIPFLTAPNLIYLLSYHEFWSFLVENIIQDIPSMNQYLFSLIQSFFIHYFSFSFCGDFIQIKDENIQTFLMDKKFHENPNIILFFLQNFFDPDKTDKFVQQSIIKVLINIFDHNPDYFLYLYLYCIHLLDSLCAPSKSHIYCNIFELFYYFLRNQKITPEIRLEDIDEITSDITLFISSTIYQFTLAFYNSFNLSYFLDQCGKRFIFLFYNWILDNEPDSIFLNFPWVQLEDLTFNSKLIIGPLLIIRFYSLKDQGKLFNSSVDLLNEDVLNIIFEIWFSLIDSAIDDRIILSIVQIILWFLSLKEVSKLVQKIICQERYLENLKNSIDSFEIDKLKDVIIGLLMRKYFSE